MDNPWHSVSAGTPKEVQAIIEVPKDSFLKYELDKETGLMKLDRPLYSAVHYPGDYGFIPQTLAEDNDPLDVIIVSNFSTYPGTLVRARPVGVLEMRDQKERDDKIVAVHASDPNFAQVKSLKDLPRHLLLEITRFFETYKELEGKKVKVLRVKGLKESHATIRKAMLSYKREF